MTKRIYSTGHQAMNVRYIKGIRIQRQKWEDGTWVVSVIFDAEDTARSHSFTAFGMEEIVVETFPDIDDSEEEAVAGTDVPEVDLQPCADCGVIRRDHDEGGGCHGWTAEPRVPF